MGKRRLTFRELRRILRSFGVQEDESRGKGGHTLFWKDFDDGRFTFLASTSRLRYGPHARSSFRPDLHLALWNPYQALDIVAPALITYGFAPPALDAVNAWLDGRVEAAGNAPVTGF